MITSARERNLSSGLFEVIASIYNKLSEQSDLTKNTSLEYLASNRQAWIVTDAAMTEEDDEDFEYHLLNLTVDYECKLGDLESEIDGV